MAAHARCAAAARRPQAALAGEGDPFRVAPFGRLPAERVSGREDAEVVAALEADPALVALLHDIGPDLTVCAYGLALRGEGEGDVHLANALVDATFRRPSIEVHALAGAVPMQPLIVTCSAFDPTAYGQPFVDAFAAQLGVAAPPDLAARFLISTVQDPFLIDTADGNFIPTLTAAMRDAILDACAEVLG